MTPFTSPIFNFHFKTLITIATPNFVDNENKPKGQHLSEQAHGCSKSSVCFSEGYQGDVL